MNMHRTARDSGHDDVAPDHDTSCHALYDTLVHHRRQHHPKPSGRRGRAKRDWAHNLVTRLETHRREILPFFDDITIPFENKVAD